MKFPTQLCWDYLISHKIRIPIHQAGFNGWKVSEGLVPSRFAHFRVVNTYTLAPDPRKLTATTSNYPKKWWLLVGRQTFLLSHCFLLVGGLISEFFGVTLGNFEILGTSTLTIHFFKQGDGFTSGS